MIVSPQRVEYVDYCTLDRSMLDLENQIELSIGCSSVNGYIIYNERELKDIYEKK